MSSPTPPSPPASTPTPAPAGTFAYKAMTASDQISVVTQRLAALEQEHYANALARMAALNQPTPDRKGAARMDTNLAILEAAILTLRAELASLQAATPSSVAATQVFSHPTVSTPTSGPVQA